MLQILLVVVLRQPHQDSLVYNLSLMVLSLVAMVPVAFVPRWLPFWMILMLRLLGLFPLFVILATLLHLLGGHGRFDCGLRTLIP